MRLKPTLPFGSIRNAHSAVQGRARFAVGGLYRSGPLKTHLEERLSIRAGVISVSASSLTGTVLVIHDDRLTTPRLAGAILSALEEFEASGEGAGKIFRPGGFPRNGTGPLSAAVCAAPGEPEAAPEAPETGEGGAERSLLRPAPEEDGWHGLEANVVLALQESSGAVGLTHREARHRLGLHGPNALPSARERSPLAVFAAQFRSLPVGLLAAAAGVSIVTGGMADAAAILAVIFLNATVGYFTESRSDRVIKSLKRMVRQPASVVREGRPWQIVAEEVVPGDVVHLKPGTYIPADARVLQAAHLTVDESALTGESMPVQKTAGALLDEVVPLADRRNMVYRGTLVTGGQGTAVVVSTGRGTEFGRIQKLVGEARPPETPLQRQLDRLGNSLVALCASVCGLVFGVGLLRGFGLLEMMKASISLAVSAVPEGLPAIATTTLAIGIRTMRRNGVLIRQLEAVETLGCIRTICLDKTGTITQNCMSVVILQAGRNRYQVKDGQLLCGGEAVDALRRQEILAVLRCCVLCNESYVEGGGARAVLTGSPTENALLELAMGCGVDVQGLRERYPLLTVAHRAENRNFMRTVHEVPRGGFLISVKGSPSEVLGLCSRRRAGGGDVPLTPEDRQEVDLLNQRMAADALRVLGLAEARISSPEDEARIDNGLTWLGLVGMTDPVRAGVAEIVAAFHGAGVDTVMITGDQSATAFAIARELRLSRGRS